MKKMPPFYMNIPLISIIVPVYNVEPYLKQCLDSLMGQTLKDIEIICVDDGSTDGSPAILQEYAAKDERIHLITQTNKGVSVARNEGMSTARAPYIMFCDPDDWCELNMCERMYHALDGVNEADIAMCGTKMEYDYEVSEQKVMSDEAWYTVYNSGLTELTEEMLLHKFSAAVWNRIFRRSFLLKHNVQFPKDRWEISEDFYFFNVCLAHSTHMVFVQDKLYHYRRRQGSVMFEQMHNNPSLYAQQMKGAMLVWDYYKEHDLLGKWNGYITKRWLLVLRWCLKQGRTKKVRRIIAKIARSFIEDNDKHTHALTDAQRSEIIRLINNATANPAIQAVKYRIKKLLINLLPAAVWRRRLRKKYL